MDHAEWFLHSTVRDKSVPGLMLMRAYGCGYLPKTGIYSDRVGASRYYTEIYRISWRQHVRSIA